MNNYVSIATISSPEFINLQPMEINPLMSQCEIKVLYIGKNRNGSVITKEVAADMAKTLRGAPIVGYFKEDKDDFRDHGQQVIMDNDGIHFNCLTQPYGFVAPDAKVWFKDFEDEDPVNGGKVVRTYLMTTGYLWTGQYEAAQKLLESGKGHSMELDEKSLDGSWTKDPNSFTDFFIINDAIFSKLCALGDDVEPCFEGSSITAPEVSKNFTLDDKFSNTLFSMMKELQETLQGGISTMAKEMNNDAVNTTSETTPVVTEATPAEAPAPEFTENAPEAQVTEPVAENDATNFEKSLDNDIQSAAAENNSNIEGDIPADFAKKEEEAKEEEAPKENSEDKKTEDTDDKKEDKEDAKKKYSLLESQFNELQDKYTKLEEEVKALREFKLSTDNKAKDALIEEFYMLSDEDKKDVVENKANYSLDEIKSKLAVICYEKKVNYVKSEDSENSLSGATINIAPSGLDEPLWLQAVDRNCK